MIEAGKEKWNFAMKSILSKVFLLLDVGRVKKEANIFRTFSVRLPILPIKDDARVANDIYFFSFTVAY